jgi:hypothetical protein
VNVAANAISREHNPQSASTCAPSRFVAAVVRQQSAGLGGRAEASVAKQS